MITVRVTPGASRNAVTGVEVYSNGNPALKVKVSAPPEDGKANAALVKLLSKAWRVPKGTVAVVSGSTARQKRLHVSCDPETATRITEWIKGI